jgi:hypothetical protein
MDSIGWTLRFLIPLRACFRDIKDHTVEFRVNRDRCVDTFSKRNSLSFCDFPIGVAFFIASPHEMSSRIILSDLLCDLTWLTKGVRHIRLWFNIQQRMHERLELLKPLA